MNLKEFLKPTRKKWLVVLVVFAISVPIIDFTAYPYDRPGSQYIHNYPDRQTLSIAGLAYHYLTNNFFKGSSWFVEVDVSLSAIGILVSYLAASVTVTVLGKHSKNNVAKWT
ncbi:hypothetical protein FJZ26_02580 [Candidatus Parvarchaeota archaeon]|nr:hypothetical protein [Candidatus Parvarchaeota archaeon]